MKRLESRLALGLVTAGLSLAGLGCGGTGTETPIQQTSATPAPAPAVAATSDPLHKAGKAEPGKGQLVTPNEKVDTSQLIDVVNKEIKGGEASGQPTPTSYFWLPADEKLIKDEPFAIKPPLGLPPVASLIPQFNPVTKGKIELGKQLYFDPRVSKDTTVSCATCHNPEKGWTDNLPTSTGILGQKGGRNAPTVLNTVYGRTMFWDGRAPSLEGQSQGPPQNKIEMGDQTYQEIIDRLRKIPGYKEQFAKVFGTDVTLDGFAKAIASFERTALSGNSAYDKYDRGDTPESLKELTESQKRGMVLFGLRLRDDDTFKADSKLFKKANCTLCHAGPNFSDELFHNLGVGWNAKENKLADLGRFPIAPVGAKNIAESGAFKTPTIRDIAKTGPYMHDGSEKTLEAVVEYYDRGGNANPWLDKDIKKLNLTAQEKKDLVEFMKALNGDNTVVALPKLPPGPDGKSPDPRAALTPPAPKSASTGMGLHGLVAR